MAGSCRHDKGQLATRHERLDRSVICGLAWSRSPKRIDLWPIDRPPLPACGGFCCAELPLPSKPPTHRPLGAKTAAEVKRALDCERSSAARRGYGPRWRRARAAYLARHPLCVRCQAAGCIEPSTVVDHVVPHRGDPVRFWSEANWQGLCKRCHDAKTAREGRWG